MRRAFATVGGAGRRPRTPLAPAAAFSYEESGSSAERTTASPPFARFGVFVRARSALS